MWTREKIEELVKQQRAYFKTHITLDVNWRIEQLIRLRTAIQQNERMLLDALHKDLGRSDTEGYISDIGAVIVELNEMIHHLKKWAKPELHWSGILAFPSLFTRVYKMPYGVSLIIAPFNFPYLLSLGVLGAAISGGNTAILKLSSKSAHCTAAVKQLIEECFEQQYIAVVDGGHDLADACLDQRVDKIFYTGSVNVAKHVMAKASQHLIPVGLELGGENGNWCVIRKDADLKDAAHKIAFFKAFNAGQVCININQIAVAQEVAEQFVTHLKEAFQAQLGESPEQNPEYAKLINHQAYQQCEIEAEKYRDRIVYGGRGEESTCKYAPTIIYPVHIDEEIVQHELFNPLLPIVTYPDDEVQKVIDTIEDREHGLSFYLFTQDVAWARETISKMQFGGGCINEVCVHLIVKGVPFNGTGHSGMGAYHGVWGFREFTHPMTVLEGKTKFNLPIREHPYHPWKLKLLKWLER